jgi:hypothetical protein
MTTPGRPSMVAPWRSFASHKKSLDTVAPVAVCYIRNIAMANTLHSLLTRREREITHALFAQGNRASAEQIRARLTNPPNRLRRPRYARVRVTTSPIAGIPMVILTRGQIAVLMQFDDYVAAIEGAFRSHAEGGTLPATLMQVDAPEGEFHIKAGGLLSPEPYFALKVTDGCFHNRERYGLSSIQGLVILASAADGRPLAVMDSMEITIQRTGAATALAARHLERVDSSVCRVRLRQPRTHPVAGHAPRFVDPQSAGF